MSTAPLMNRLLRRLLVRSSKYVLLLLSALLFLGAGGFVWHTHSSSAALSRDMAVEDAQNFAESVTQFRNFYASEIVPRAREAGMSITHDYKHLPNSLPLPATFTLDFGEFLVAKASSTHVQLYSAWPFPYRKAARQVDDFQQEAMRHLSVNPNQPIYRFEQRGGQAVLRYAQADRMLANCVQCHNTYPGSPKTDWQVGDVRGVLEIVRPMARLTSQAQSNLRNDLILSAVIVTLSLILVGFSMGSLRQALRQSESLADERADINQKLTAEIAQRAQIEHDLRMHEAKLNAVFDSVLEGIIVIDQRGHIVQINQAISALFGYQADELLGCNINKLMPENHARAHDGYLAHYLATGEQNILRKPRKVHALHRSGQAIPIRLAVSEVKVGGERLYTGIIQDISERMTAEKALREARDSALESARMKSEFLANMSHEIRTPMNGVIGMTHLLLDTPLTSEQQELAETVRNCGESLLSVINDILDFSKIEAGKLEFEEIEFDLTQNIEECLLVLAERAQNKGLDLTYQIAAEVPIRLHGDAGRLRQVLTNLIGNAVKFTEHGHICVTVTLLEQQLAHCVLRFNVADTGMGIPPDRINRLFQPFSQVDGSITRRFGGTGLGLAISRQIVAMMQGEVGVNSEVGQGSNFWFTARFDQPAMLTSLNSATSPLPTMAMPNVPLLMIGIGTEANNPVLAQLRHWQLNIDYLQAAADLEPAISLLQQRLADKNRIQPKAVFIDHPQLSEARAFWLAKLLNITENNIFWVELTPLANSNRNEPSQSGHLRLAKPLRRENLFNVLQTVSQNLTLADKVTTVPSIAATAVPSAHRLLLVEDNVINQKVALGLLAKLGYRADVARDGHEALACLQNNQYDLILMDCHMPGMDGFQATAAIRRNEENRGQRIPIIALTADDTPEDEARCRAVGMDAHLGKPINREALRAVLAAWLD